MTKLGEEDIKTIQYLRKIRGYTVTELAREYGVARATISYWTNPVSYVKKKEYAREHSKRVYREKRSMMHKNRERYREYQREYHRKRYNTDDKFREKVLEINACWRKRNKV